MPTILTRLWCDERAVTGTEYAIMVVFVALVLALGAGVLGTDLSTLFSTVGGDIAIPPPLPTVP